MPIIPESPSFDSDAHGDAWWTDAARGMICMSSGAQLSRDINARLRQVFSNTSAELIARRPDGGVGPRSSIGSSPRFDATMAAYLWAAYRQWYGPNDSRTLAAARAWRSRRVDLEMLRDAIWFTYYTTGGSAPDYNGNQTSAARPPAVSAARDAAVQIKPSATLPPWSEDLGSDSAPTNCIPAPSRTVASTPTTLSGPSGSSRTPSPNRPRTPSPTQAHPAVSSDWMAWGLVAVGVSGAAWWLWQSTKRRRR